MPRARQKLRKAEQTVDLHVKIRRSVWLLLKIAAAENQSTMSEILEKIVLANKKRK